MCPSVAVLGGGGDGGGGSGGDGGDGNGDGNGTGDGNGDGANGDGKGAGACGPGGPGACSNCGHNVAAGDPVDVVSGKVFTIPVHELYLPGLFALALIRGYGSDNRKADLGMGFGWTHSLAWRLEEHRDHLLVRAGDGTRTVLPLPRNPDEQIRMGAWGVYRAGDLYVVRPGNEFIHFFERQAGTDYFRLAFVKFRSRGVISLQYEGASLARVVDSVGRVILLERTIEGRVSSISVPDTSGRSIVFARDGYDSAGNLVTAADAEGAITTYAYDDEHRLTRLEYPSGLCFHFRYDGRGRCIETWGDGPDVPLVLGKDASPTLTDGGPARGIYHCRLHFDEQDYSEVSDSTRFQRYFAGPGGKISKAVGPRGGVTTREFDDLGRVVRQTDPNGATWSYAHDRLDEIVREIDAEGNEIRFERDSAGRLLSVTDATGGVVTVGRDETGEISFIEDQAGSIKRFVRNASGLVLECHDSRGTRHTFIYDAHANCIEKTSGRGGSSTAVYDYWGRLLEDTDPIGATRRFSYSNSGKLVTATDRNGSTKTFGYDVMGNCVSETDADGATTRWEFGGLNWCRLERLADGTETRIEYNREGFATALFNARGQVYSLERDPQGQIARETSFAGQTIRFGYDKMGRVVSYDEGHGKHEIERNKIGLVVAHVAPDGASRRFDYNPRGQLVRAESDGTTFSWDLDPVGRVLREELSFDGAVYTVMSDRNSAGDRIAVETSLGHRLSMGRDGSGQLASASDDVGEVMRIERNLLGLPVRSALPGGASIVDEYDAVRRLRRREVVPSGAPAATRPGEPEWLGSSRPDVIDYQFDYALSDELVTVRGNADTIDYEYDLVRHLRSARRNTLVEELDADANGNVFERGPAAPARIYDRGDRLTSRGSTEYIYDALGCLVEERSAGTTTRRYRWDGFQLLRGVEMANGTKVSFQYDAFARRVAKTVTHQGGTSEAHHYVWDLVNMLHDVPVDRSGPGRGFRTYLFTDNDDVRPIGHRDVVSGASNAWRFYVNDPLGTPEEIIDGAGKRLAKLSRTAFGLTDVVGSEYTPFRFPGQQEDRETGLHYNRFRTYDPVTGRYLSSDPMALEAGTNLYAYARNPVGWSDPLGLHDLTHSTDDPGFVPTQGMTTSRGPMAGPPFYRSGRGPNMPDQLACVRGADARTHSEQQFAHDLISQRGNQQGAGTTHNLGGTYPPCPNCHGAMMRAARETGATINYSLTQNGETQSIRYTGAGAQATSGALANHLAGPNGVYDHQLTGNYQGVNRPGDPGQTYTSDSRQYWGFDSGPGAQGQYQAMRDAQRAGVPYNP